LFSFIVKNNNEYVSVVKLFLKASIKLHQILIIINEDYLVENRINEIHIKDLNKLDRKILITNFYINGIIKLFLYDFRNIMINYIRDL